MSEKQKKLIEFELQQHKALLDHSTHGTEKPKQSKPKSHSSPVPDQPKVPTSGGSLGGMSQSPASSVLPSPAVAVSSAAAAAPVLTKASKTKSTHARSSSAAKESDSLSNQPPLLKKLNTSAGDISDISDSHLEADGDREERPPHLKMSLNSKEDLESFTDVAESLEELSAAFPVRTKVKVVLRKDPTSEHEDSSPETFSSEKDLDDVKPCDEKAQPTDVSETIEASQVTEQGNSEGPKHLDRQAESTNKNTESLVQKVVKETSGSSDVAPVSQQSSVVKNQDTKTKPCHIVMSDVAPQSRITVPDVTPVCHPPATSVTTVNSVTVVQDVAPHCRSLSIVLQKLGDQPNQIAIKSNLAFDNAAAVSQNKSTLPEAGISYFSIVRKQKGTDIHIVTDKGPEITEVTPLSEISEMKPASEPISQSKSPRKKPARKRKSAKDEKEDEESFTALKSTKTSHATKTVEDSFSFSTHDATESSVKTVTDDKTKRLLIKMSAAPVTLTVRKPKDEISLSAWQPKDEVAVSVKKPKDMVALTVRKPKDDVALTVKKPKEDISLSVRKPKDEINLTGRKPKDEIPVSSRKPKDEVSVPIVSAVTEPRTPAHHTTVDLTALSEYSFTDQPVSPPTTKKRKPIYCSPPGGPNETSSTGQMKCRFVKVGRRWTTISDQPADATDESSDTFSSSDIPRLPSFRAVPQEWHSPPAAKREPKKRGRKKGSKSANRKSGAAAHSTDTPETSSDRKTRVHVARYKQYYEDDVDDDEMDSKAASSPAVVQNYSIEDLHAGLLRLGYRTLLLDGLDQRYADDQSETCTLWCDFGSPLSFHDDEDDYEGSCVSPTNTFYTRTELEILMEGLSLSGVKRKCVEEGKSSKIGAAVNESNHVIGAEVSQTSNMADKNHATDIKPTGDSTKIIKSMKDSYSISDRLSSSDSCPKSLGLFMDYGLQMHVDRLLSQSSLDHGGTGRGDLASVVDPSPDVELLDDGLAGDWLDQGSSEFELYSSDLISDDVCGFVFSGAGNESVMFQESDYRGGELWIH